MSVSTSPNVAIGPDVPEFLRKNDAEAAFQTVLELIRECFPQTQFIEAELQEDHDMAGWQRVALTVTLPESAFSNGWLEQHKRYHELRVDRVPLPQNMLFPTLFVTPAE